MKKFLKIGFICSFALLLGIGIFLPTRVNSQYAGAYLKPQYNNDYTYDDTWVSYTPDGLSLADGSRVWSDGIDIYYSYGTAQYVFDVSTHTWSAMTWYGYTSIQGQKVWSDGNKFYYSNNANQYVLDVSTHTWSSIVWNGLGVNLNGESVWSDGINTYYSSGANQYILSDASTYTWSSITWVNNTSFTGLYVWTDGTDIYYSSSGIQYKLTDVLTHTWTAVTWYFPIANFNPTGSYVWTDGVNTYYSAGVNQFILSDASSYTWSAMTWDSPSYVNGSKVWTDGVDIYCNLSSSSISIVLYGTYNGGGDTPDSDVVPNYPYIMPTIMEAFIGGFTGCFDFLGTAIAENFSDLFLEENINTNQLGLSVFGTLVFSFVGLCIALKVFKFIVKFIIRKGDAKYEKE